MFQINHCHKLSFGDKAQNCVDAVHSKMVIFYVLFNCLKLSINLVSPSFFLRYENWGKKLFFCMASFLPLVRSLSISSLRKLISSPENWRDLVLYCILGEPRN